MEAHTARTSTPYALALAALCGAALLASRADAAPCRPQGAPPAGYDAPAIAEAGRVDLSGSWELDTRSRDFTSPRAVQLPGPFVAIPRGPGGLRQLWLRRRFTLSEVQDPKALAMDLGGRFGLTVVWLNGERIGASKRFSDPFFRSGGLPLKRGENELVLEVTLGDFYDGLRWYGDAAVGRPTTRQRGIVVPEPRTNLARRELAWSVLIPPCADLTQPRPLIVALPGAGGSVYAYAATRLREQAEARGWLMLTFDAVLRRYYTGPAEEAIIATLERVTRELPVDPERIYMTGYSMGGSGTLHIGYHHPDRFAAIAPFFAIARYGLGNALWKQVFRDSPTRLSRHIVMNFPGNARNLPVLHVHAVDDPLVPVHHARLVHRASARLGLTHHTLRLPERGGHRLETIEAATDDLIAWFAQHKRARLPRRVSHKASAPRHTRAWWLELELARPGAFGEADLEWDAASRTLQVHTLHGLRSVQVDGRALALWGAPVTLTVASPHQGRVVLTGAPEAGRWRLTGPGGEPHALSNRDGAVTLPPLHEGRHQLTPVAPP